MKRQIHKMVYAIENEYMKVAVDTVGAELKSIYRKNGNIEHLWQGDEKYWKGRSPILFPIVGRLYDGKYSLGGKEYGMNPHGLLRKVEFVLVEKTCKSMTFAYSANDDTFAHYPFAFIFKAVYSLCGNRLTIKYVVKNVGNDVMYFGLGGHPGFNVPFDGGDFEDYYLETSLPVRPERMTLTESYLMSGKAVDYPLEKDRIIRLKHDMFDDDAVILRGAGDSLTLKSDMTDKSVTVKYPNMPYVGLWHAVKTDAPYVCIEPWENLPSLDGKVEKLTDKANIGILPRQETYESSITVSLD